MTNKKDYAPIKIMCNGATKDIAFGWKILEASGVVLSLVDESNGTATPLQYGKDYTVSFKAMGGSVTTTQAYPEGFSLLLERKTSNYQGKSFSTSMGFQASEVEKSFDNVSMCLQDMNHNIESFKEEYSAETNQKITDFEDEINSKLTQVTEAVNQLNRLDEVLEACEGYAVSAEEQSIIAQNQAVLSEEFAGTAEQTLAQLQQEHSLAIENVEATKAQAIKDVQASGIYMKGDRLFYRDTKGVEHEFRNDFGGIPPMPVKHKEVKKIEGGFELTWSEPDDSIYMDNVYCKWGNTLILRKQGSYPESPFDGEIVVNNTVRNQYAETPFFDEVDTSKDWYYRAFPRSINRVYSQDELNKFGVWVYSFTRLKKETIPSEKIVYRGANEYYEKSYMDFSSDTFKYGDWKDAPFLLKDRLAPCVVGFDGEVKYFLNPDNYALKEDGTASDITDTSQNINCYMRFKILFRRKRKNANGDTEVDISNVKINDEYKAYGGFVKTDGTLREYIYLPIYRGSLVNNKMRSMSGNLTPISSKTATEERNYCTAVGAGHDMITRADREMIEDLAILMFKTTDFQSALGQGKSNGGSDVGACLKSGTMDNKGYNVRVKLYNKLKENNIDYPKIKEIPLDVIRYIYLVSVGKFWDEILPDLNEPTNGITYNIIRQDVKVIMFAQVFYGKQLTSRGQEYAKIFKEEFPKVYSIILSFKRGLDKNERTVLTHKLMALESRLFREILRRLYELNYAVISIHDAVVVLDVKENNDCTPTVVKEVIEKVYNELGLIPDCSVDYYGKEEMELFLEKEKFLREKGDELISKLRVLVEEDKEIQQLISDYDNGKSEIILTPNKQDVMLHLRDTKELMYR